MLIEEDQGEEISMAITLACDRIELSVVEGRVYPSTNSDMLISLQVYN